MKIGKDTEKVNKVSKINNSILIKKIMRNNNGNKD